MGDENKEVETRQQETTTANTDEQPPPIENNEVETETRRETTTVQTEEKRSTAGEEEVVIETKHDETKISGIEENKPVSSVVGQEDKKEVGTETRPEADDKEPSSDLYDESKKNTKLIRCRVCQCKIMRPNNARLVSRETYLHTDRKKTLPPHPDHPEQTQPSYEHEKEKVVWFWHLTDMYSFENMGFSKTVDTNTKYLTCADCEREIIGFQILSEGNNFYLAANRVDYE